MLTADQITAIAPDAQSLKAGRDLASPRKWEMTGGDSEVLWGLAMGSGKEPYQTRVSLIDFASKCSCPSRKFPCKHALGLMFLAAGSQVSAAGERPPWVVEWLEARAGRAEKAAARSEEKATKPVDEKAAEKRRAQREGRVAEGVALLQQTLLDLAREGLASGPARSASAWEGLAKRMVDCQAPGLAGALRHIADTVLPDPDVDSELPYELGRLHLLLHALASPPSDDGNTRAELLSWVGGKSGADRVSDGELQDDDWFVAGRRVEERDRLITSTTWMLGVKSLRWAKLLRFAPVPQTIAEPWPLGARVRAALRFHPGLLPQRATVENEEMPELARMPVVSETHLDSLLERHSSALASNPFLRTIPFLIPLHPSADGTLLVDESGRALPWKAPAGTALRVECVCGGRPTPLCGEWDGRFLRPLSLLDGGFWFSLIPKLT